MTKRDRSSASSTVAQHVKKNTDAVKCESCLDDIQDNDAGKLACQSRHTLCGECSAIFCESVLAAGPEAVTPAKCCTCRSPIPALSLERILTQEQLSTYLNYVAIRTIQDGESLVSCVNCSYCEVHTDEPAIFWCRNGACQTVHCVGCKAKLPTLMEEREIITEEDEEEFMEGQSAHVFHLQCSALRREKTAFDEAILAGSGMACPGCNVVGRKDGTCTHMTCSGCATVWCYLCGLSVDDCDKAPRYGEASQEPIYGHNEGWEENPKRCPMYISMIAEVDGEWDFEEELDDSDADYDEQDLEELCLNKFHRYRTLQKLHVSIVLNLGTSFDITTMYSRLFMFHSATVYRLSAMSLERKSGVTFVVLLLLSETATLRTRRLPPLPMCLSSRDPSWSIAIAAVLTTMAEPAMERRLSILRRAPCRLLLPFFRIRTSPYSYMEPEQHSSRRFSSILKSM